MTLNYQEDEQIEDLSTDKQHNITSGTGILVKKEEP